MSTALLQRLTRPCFSCIKREISQNRYQSLYRVALAKEALQDLSFEERKSDKLTDNQVRIRVQYCSVNAFDLTTFSNVTPRLPFAPGYELSGEIVEVGKNVTNNQILKGEKVAALSLDKFGAFAEECVLDVNDVFRLPSDVQLKDAAVLTSAHATALWAFSQLCKVKENDLVLVTAGSAGFGLAGVDIAANVYRAKVIGVVDFDEKSEMLRQRGAFQTLRFNPKLLKNILAATGKKGVSVVYDAIGEHMLDVCNKSVSHGGKIFYVAPTIGTSVPTPPLNTTFSVLSLAELRKQDFECYRNLINDTLELANEGVIGAHVSASFDFTDINKALTYIKQPSTIGKSLE